MCGIAGWFSTDNDMRDKEDILSRMSATLERRGPDEHGAYVERDIALLHRRLAVIDIEHGKQPMTFVTERESYTIVYNGELYNTDELRDRLIADGYTFEGHSDTEVVLKLYSRYGERCSEMLNGIFAFAIYESRQRRLFLCRDRIGVKPLFFHRYRGGFVFGSEIKAILQSGVVTPTISEQGLYEIFFLSPARTPGCGIFDGIEELLPGEYAIYQNGILRRRHYYRLTAREHEDNEQQTIERVRYLLTDSIERQLVSDVPLCFFLSGGLDSSIICQTAANFYRRNKLGEIHTYSVEYVDNRKYFEKNLFQPNADYDYIHLMVDSTAAEHREVILDNADVVDALYDSVDARDVPGYVDIDSSLLLFCRRIKEDFTVALSGECADELFGGYPWYHNRDILFEECFPWSREQSTRRKVVRDGLLKRGEEYVHEKYLETVRRTDKLPTDSPLSSRMREMFMLNFYWFMQCLLERKDRCSMYSGLEVRVPFCDYRVVDYAYNMPWELKAYAGREKGIVRKAFEDILPRDIVYRKKSPYPKTHNPVYMHECSKRVRQILNDDTRTVNVFLSREGVTDIMEHPDQLKSPWYGQLMRAPQVLAYIIELDYWFEKYKPVIKSS